MEKLTLFSHVLPEEQERCRICFCMREVTYQNHEIIMEYANSMKKTGVILEARLPFTALMLTEPSTCWMN